MIRRMVLASLLLGTLPLAAYARKWVDSTGQFSIEAEFVELTKDDRVRLKQASGKILSIPLAKLSEADRNHVKELTAPPGEESPFAADLLPADNKPARPGKASKPGAAQTVVVEGVGLTPDAALKDAYRQAVRQVMGSVIDAKTLVQNDELIEDKVLTYSDGFITNAKELSVKSRDGLVRIRISADVERRSLIEKLTAANITMKKLDGGNLFAELTTQLDAEASAAALVRERLKDFPLNCLTANVDGKPEIVSKDETKAKLRFYVRYQADLKAYDAFAERMTSVLEKIAKQKGEFSIAGAPSGGNRPGFYLGGKIDSGDSAWQEKIAPVRFWRDRLSGKNKSAKDGGEIVLAVNVQRTSNFGRSDWRYYVLDRSVLPVLASTAAVAPHTKLTLVGLNGDVAVERFVAADKSNGDYFHASSLYAAYQFGGSYDKFYYGYGSDSQKWGYFPGYHQTLIGRTYEQNGVTNYTGERLFLIAPMFFGGSQHARRYQSSFRRYHDVELSLEELKKVTSVRCELKHDGSLPPEQETK